MIRKFAYLVPLLCSLAACGAQSTEREGGANPQIAQNEVTLKAIPFAPDLTLPAKVGEVTVLAVHQLSSEAQWFGGLSGSYFDGETLWSVNDSGHYVQIPMKVDESGVPTQMGELNIAPLGGLDGGKYDGDAEELLRLDDTWLVSFERRHRLLEYKYLGQKPKVFPTPQGFSRQPSNGGVEAMAKLANGDVLALSENGGEQEMGLAWLWIAKERRWANLTYLRTGLFVPTGAATLPNGDVLVVERRFTLIGGVGLRIALIEGESIVENAVMTPRELAIMTPPMAVDNFESVSVVRQSNGNIIAYILSDDNFNQMQSTLLLTVKLP